MSIQRTFRVDQGALDSVDVFADYLDGETPVVIIRQEDHQIVISVEAHGDVLACIAQIGADIEGGSDEPALTQ